MPVLEFETDIAADPATVYQAFMSFSDYPDWNPMVASITGDPTPGNYVDVQLTIGSRAPQTYHAEVLQNDQNKHVRWAVTLVHRLFFRGEHYFMFEPSSTGGTRFIHGENFTGVFASPLLYVMGEDFSTAYLAFNQALKNRVESQNTSQQ